MRVLAIVACVVLLLSAAGGAALWLLHAQASLDGYRSPMRAQPREMGHDTTPLAPQVVLAVIDGLRYDAVAAMPTLSLLQRQGAAARAMLRTPAYSQPTWITLVTGAWQDISGAPLLNVPNSQLGPISVDHIFAAAKRANLTTAIAGPDTWARMIPRDLLDASYFVEGPDAAADSEVADTSLRFLDNFHPGLTLIHFSNVDTVGETAGATGPAYRQAALEVDDHLRDIVDALDLRHAVLIVTADHGQIARGGHGGGEPEVLTTPFVAVGDAVVPGDYGTIAQVDIAPTIAAILGAPVPRLSQGIVRFEMLRADEPTRAEAEAELALQRQEYGNLYLHSIARGSLSETAEGDIEVTLSSLEVQNYESTYGLARIAVEKIDQEIAQARAQRIQRERGLRLPVAAAFVALPLAFLLLRGGARGRWLFLFAALSLAVYHAVFLAEGQVYSFSGLTGMEPFLLETARRMAVALGLGAALILWRLIRDGEGSALEVIQTSLGYSLLLAYLLGCQAAVVYWLNGIRFTWYVLDMGLTYWLLASLVQVLMAVAAGIVLPIILLVAGLAYQASVGLGRRLRARWGGT